MLFMYVCMMHVYAGTGKVPRLQWVAAWKDLDAMSRQRNLTEQAGHLKVPEGLENVVPT
jgi:hypothetical protein